MWELMNDITVAIIMILGIVHIMLITDGKFFSKKLDEDNK